MGKAIVVTSGKGGVGKTSASANIAASLALQNYKVAAVDADIGLRNLDVALGAEKDIVYNLVDVAEKKCRLKQALVPYKHLDGLCLLAASQTKLTTEITPHQMAKIITELKGNFDYVIIDCPAGIEHGFRNALAGADEAIIVTTPDVAAIRDADRVVTVIKEQYFIEAALIVNKVRFDMMRRGEMIKIDDITGILGIELIGIVPDGKDAVIAGNKGEPICMDAYSLVGQAYRNIARRIGGEDIEFLKYIKKESALKRLLRTLSGEANV